MDIQSGGWSLTHGQTRGIWIFWGDASLMGALVF